MRDTVLAGKMEAAGKRRNCCLGLPLFVLNLSGLLLFYMIGTVYTAAVIRTLERRFGLRSSQTGLLFACNELTNTVVVLFIGFFGRRAHKPRMIAITILFAVASFLIMALPHFLFSSPSHKQTTTGNSTNSDILIASATASQFCPSVAFNKTASGTDDCDVATSSDSRSDSPEGKGLHPAYYIFVIAQLFSGIGSSGLMTLGVTYIDENAPKSKSSMYIGIVSSMFAIGPLCAFVLSGFTLRLPENLLTPSSDKPGDLTFIGCWWLGYVICGIVLLSFAIPLWFFPKSIKDLPLNSSTQLSRSTGSKGLLAQIKEFPHSVRLLLSNKIYLINLGCALCAPYIIMGINSNIVRYVEVHFLERAFVGSIIAALAAALPGAIGSFAGGLIMSKMRLTPPGAVRIMIFAAACFATGLLVILFLRCPQTSVAGRINPTQNTVNVLNDCNRHCGCQTDRKSFVPVCGSDNLTYFSACFAGCTQFVNGTNLGCACLTSGTQMSANRSLMQLDFSGTARPGFCESRCQLLIPFAVVLFVMYVLGYMSTVPVTMVNLRVVDGDERSFALAVCGFIVNISGFTAPLLFGRLIDSSCRMWQRTAAIPLTSSSCDRNPLGGSSGETGSCLLYDTTKIRHRIFGPVLGFKLLDLVFAVILYIFIRKMVFKNDHEEEVKQMGARDVNANGDVEDSQPLNVQKEETELARLVTSGADFKHRD